MFLRLVAWLAIGLAVWPVASANPGWDTTQPRGKTRTIDFTTSVGTWMSVDVSPDNKWLVFDLLDHVYRVSTSGGQAECLTQDSGVALNYRPRYSPDGRWIAFVSDRGGQNNLWVMAADGSQPRAVFSSLDVRVSEIAWSGDSQFLVVNQGSAPFGAGELWKYPLAGGAGQKLIAGVSWPALSRDGKFLYFQYNEEHGADFHGAPPGLIGGTRQVGRMTLLDGERFNVTMGAQEAQSRRSSGGAIAPEISPDGRWLAFSRRVPGGTISYKGHKFGPRSSLLLLDLKTGAERLLVDPIQQDGAESGARSNVLPAYAWSADGASLYYSEGGKLRRVDVASGQVSTIAFTAKVHRVISQRAAHEFRIDDRPFEAKYVRGTTASPDGSKLVFQAVGELWIQNLPNGTPRRLTPDSVRPFEYAPAWSPDGRWIAFTTWDEKENGLLWRISTQGQLEQLTPQAGEYFNPAWSADGKSIVVARGAGVTQHGRSLAEDPWFDLVRLDIGGGQQDIATVREPYGLKAIVRPLFAGDGDVLYQEDNEHERTSRLFSIRPDGTHKRVLLQDAHGRQRTDSYDAGPTDDIAPSPDGRWVAFTEFGNVFVAPFGPTLDRTKARQVSRTGGLDPRWRDSHTLEFGSAGKYFVYHLDTSNTDTRQIHLTVQRDIPTGTIALTNARIVTLASPEVIEKGTLVIRASRIVCVGDCPTAKVDRSIDVAGKTIIPGFVDMHAHHYVEYEGVIPTHGPSDSVYLAYGVTSTLDPAIDSREIFAARELIDAGKVSGPRTYSTGDPMDGSNPELPDSGAVEATERKLQSWGATAIKQYAQPRRQQKQWTDEAARKLGLNVTSEGQELTDDLAMAMDGQAGFEHHPRPVPLYDDVTRFLGAAGMCYSPTLMGSPMGPWGEQYYWAKSDLWADPKQQQWVPWRKLWPAARRPIHRPDSDYMFPMAAQSAADIVAAGGCAAIGGHNLQPGLASHWNIWAMAMAMSNYQALKVASFYGAHFLGAERDIGSIVSGKLADLVVLNSNPLEKIENTTDIQYVMKGGVLYNADLDQVWPRQEKFGEPLWRQPDMYRLDDKAIDATTLIQPGAPGKASQKLTPEQSTKLSQTPVNAADVQFMQHMIVHHGQAVEMVNLLSTRTQRDDMRQLAERIRISQSDEIKWMRDWLSSRGESVEAQGHAHHAGMTMNGMLTPAQMHALAQAKAELFDRLFLEGMIQHHQGALDMVHDLLRTPGAGEDPRAFDFMSEVESDQTAEINRMRTMLTAPLASASRTGPVTPAAPLQTDARSKLSAGYLNAPMAAMNMKLVATVPRPDGFFDPDSPYGIPKSPTAPPQKVGSWMANTDLAFSHDLAVVGNYHGFNLYDIKEEKPKLVSSVVCPGGQTDVSIYGHLVFVSIEQPLARTDCGGAAATGDVNHDRFRGVRIFDISNPVAPRQVAAVQTCRGSHTNTIVPDPRDSRTIYIYNSGTAPPRSPEELAGCVDRKDSPQDPNPTLYSIDVIAVPLDAPEKAAIVSQPRVFADSDKINGLWKGGSQGAGAQEPMATDQCHDITVYLDLNLAAGACAGNGILLDIGDPVHPKRLDAVADPNFVYWHGAVFSNDGSKVLFTDEWGWGAQPRCRATDPANWGGDVVLDIVNSKLVERSFYKLPSVQSDNENCVAHNGGLVPVPGRDIVVQAWYGGGITVFDMTDSQHPFEIAYFDRGPVDSTGLVIAGQYAAYWYKGRIYGSEIMRGFDVLKLQPSLYLSANEIAAAELVSENEVNPQSQHRLKWPEVPVVGRAYVDQLVRNGSMSTSRARVVGNALDKIQRGHADSKGDQALAETLLKDASTAQGRDVERLKGIAAVLRSVAF